MDIIRRDLLAGTAALAASLAPHRAFGAPEDIVVGAPNSLSGGFGEAGFLVVIGLQLATAEINEQGGIKGLGGARLRVQPAEALIGFRGGAGCVTQSGWR